MALPVHKILARLVTAGALVMGAFLLNVAPSSAIPVGNAPLSTQPGNLASNDLGAWSNMPGAYATYGLGHPGRVIVDSNGLTGETFTTTDSRFFTGVSGTELDTPLSSTQTVDLSPSAIAIDNGSVTADVSTYLGGRTSSNTRSKITFEFKDAGGASVDSVDFPFVTAADRGNVSGFIHFADEVTVPVGTRSALLTITTIKEAGTGSGYIDEVTLKLSAPTPVATDATPTTVQDQAVTFNPADDATATAPATIVPASVRLLDDNGDQVTTLTNSDGTYTVDTATGDITFTPATGFTGTTTPVGYSVTDSNGQVADGSIAVTVGPTVGGSLLNGPTAVGLLALVVLGSGVIAAVRRRRSVNG